MHATRRPGPAGAPRATSCAHDWAGNVSQTGSVELVVDATAPMASVKSGAQFTVATGESFNLVSYGLHDAGKIDRVEINGVEKDLVDDRWSDVNGLRPGVFGAVRGANELTVFDVAGNSRTYEFTLD